MRLTEQQIRDTVKAMGFNRESEREEVLRRALAGEPTARFAVYAKWQRMQPKGA